MRRPLLACVTAVGVLALAAPAHAGHVLERDRDGSVKAIGVFKRAHRAEFGVVTARTFDSYAPNFVRLWRTRPSGRALTPQPRDITPPGSGMLNDVAVAYDSDRDRYLEVAASEGRLVAQRLSGTGRRIGSPERIGGGHPFRVHLLYIPSKRRYLVAWGDTHTGRVRFRALDATGHPRGHATMPLGKTEPWTVQVAYDPRGSGVVATFGDPAQPEDWVRARRLDTGGRPAGNKQWIDRDGAVGALGYSPGSNGFVAFREGLDNPSTVLISPDGARRGPVHRFGGPKGYPDGFVYPGAVAAAPRRTLVTWTIAEEVDFGIDDWYPFARRLDATSLRAKGRNVPLRTPHGSRLRYADEGAPVAARGARRWLVAWPVRDAPSPNSRYDPDPPAETEWGVAVQPIR